MPSVAVIRLPHISNFNDFNPLDTLDGLNLYFLEKARPLSNFKAVILPGSKNTCYDLNWLHESGWSESIKVYAGAGGHVLGICGGYQMMGIRVHDPDGLEGSPGSTPGLNLLPVETWLKAPKTTTLTEFTWQGDQGAGYEIHMGQTEVKNGSYLFEVTARNDRAAGDRDGCVASDHKLIGTYIHGIFDNPKIVHRWLGIIGVAGIEVSELESRDAKDREYDLLAAHFESYIDVAAIMEMLNLQQGKTK
jgi:adenosylcobyric acid synthase